MTAQRTIAVFTGNRAEYGLQLPILRAIQAHPDLRLLLFVSGAHLDPDFGRTKSEIEADGFTIDAEIRIDMPTDSLIGTAYAIGSGVISMTEALALHKPDMLVVYADRFEGFAAVIAGTQMGLPTAHIEGGDVTEGGALDDSVRHAMTKLAHLHFTTNQQASNRLLAMGEEPWRVHTVGLPAIDLIVAGEVAGPDEIRERIGIDPDRPLVVFTQHSVATQFDRAASQLAPSLEALERLAAEGVQIVLTYPNNDAGGRRIIERLDAFGARGLSNVLVRSSLGRHLYHGMLALACDPVRRVVCAGNSSSGIKETPAFGCPAVDIGSRQEGRLRGGNVLETPYDASDIEAALRTALFDQAFREAARTAPNPYGLGGAGVKVAEAIAGVALDERLIRKGMTLRGEACEGWFR